MRPLLRAALAATLLASLALALWPQDEAAVVPVVTPTRRPAAPPAGAVPAVATGTGAATASAARPAPAAAASAVAAPLLPTRAADWPAPPAAGLAAWQGRAAALPPPAAAPRQAALQAAAAAEAVSSPAAPVFPYRWIGQLDDGGAPQLLLASAQRSVAVRLGATLDGRWRLVRHANGQLLAQALPDGDAVPVPGAPPAAP